MTDLKEYGFDPAMMPEYADGMPARVTAVHKERYVLICGYGPVYGRLKAGTYFGDTPESFPTTGDFVLITHNLSGDSQIIKTLDRKSYFSRRDPTPGRGEQAVAANFDYVFIMASLNFDFNIRRMERYMTLARQSGAVAVVVLTKADLADDFAEQVRAAEKTAAGARIHVVSAKTGFGLAELSDYMQPRKTIVFLGSSGVGKSSLVNVLASEEIMPVNDIREDDSKGRHTTSLRQLIMLKNGVMIIDTPGMRELGMWDVSSGLGQAFTDVEAFFGHCRFSDCLHESEPGCAVKEALSTGLLTQERWDSYQKLKHEARYTDNKTDYMRQKQQWHKSIAVQIKQRRKAENYKSKENS